MSGVRALGSFKLVDAGTADEAARVLARGNAWPLAGGTDIIHLLRFRVLPDGMYPDVLVNLKTISPSLEYIRYQDGALRIGALTKLSAISRDAAVKERFAALAAAAGSVGSPQIRNAATVGGDIAQFPRGWYFRKPDDRFHCLRKGGDTCYARTGDNRYHSIFGGINGCVAVNMSDVAPALVALDAGIVTNKRTIRAEDFWDVRVPRSTVLEQDEVMLEVRIPAPPRGARSSFEKFAVRKAIDFPIVNGAALIGDGLARIALNAVYPVPYRAGKAEEVLRGRTDAIDEELAEEAADAAVSGAVPLAYNGWKVQVARSIVKRLILPGARR